MTCPRCGTKTRSKIVCPACGHRSRRPYWLLLLTPLAVALAAFTLFVGDAYFEKVLRSTDSLADKVDLNIGDDTASADDTSKVDFASLQKSMYTVSYGSGFLISPRDVLTAASNVAGLRNIIMYHDGKGVSGTVVGRTKQIAVIRIAETDDVPFKFTQAIAGEDETLLTLTMKERIVGTLSFSGSYYSRNFELPRHAVGSPLLSSSGRVVAIHLRGIAVPTAMFEQEARSFIEAKVPAPLPAELTPVEPVTPDVTEETPSIDVPAAEPDQAPETDSKNPAEGDAVEEEPTEPAEPPESDEPAADEPPTTEPDEPAEPEEPTEPPETDDPGEDDPPTTEPDEPSEPEEPEEPTEPDTDIDSDDTPTEDDEEQTSTPST